MLNYREWYQVNEIFTSIQGEGILAGTPATFIRLQGCPVGCPWCDSGPLADELKGRMTNGETRNTWGAGGTKMSVPEIISQVRRVHVIITGGEPIIWDLDALIMNLRDNGHYVQIETSGLKDFIGAYLPDHITISPKAKLNYVMPKELMKVADEIKWVVDDELTFDTVYHSYMDDFFQLMTPLKFVLMPEGCPPSQEHIQKAMSFLDQFNDLEPDLGRR